MVAMNKQERAQRAAAYEARARWCRLWAFRARRRGQVGLAEEYELTAREWERRARAAQGAGGRPSGHL